MRETLISAEMLEEAGLISKEELERIRAVDQERERRDSARLSDSNRRAGIIYDALPRWRRLLIERSAWVCKHRDYLPL